MVALTFKMIIRISFDSASGSSLFCTALEKKLKFVVGEIFSSNFSKFQLA